MKFLTSLFCVLLATLTFGQNPIALKLDNHHPRVGEDITISFPLVFIDNQVDAAMTDLQDNIQKSALFNYRESSSYEKTFAFDSPGEYVVGPFEFSFNDSTYSTDSIIVTVIEDIPFEEGVWVRLVEENGKQFLIIEQYADGIEVPSYSPDNFGTNSNKAPKSDFADLKETSINGVTFSTRYTSTKQRSENENNFMGPKLTYRYRKYAISFESGVTSKLVLTKKDFQSFPKKVKFETIEILPAN